MIILKYFSLMAEIVLSREHPFSRALAQLAVVCSDQLEQVINLCYRSTINSLEKYFGPLNFVVLQYQANDEVPEYARLHSQKLVKEPELLFRSYGRRSKWLYFFFLLGCRVSERSPIALS